MQSNYLRVIALLSPLLMCVSCREKEKIGVEYREEAKSETATAVADAFRESAVSLDEIDPKIEEFFTRLGQASREQGKMNAEDLFSVDAMLEALESGGMLKGIEGRSRREFDIGFRNGVKQLDQAISQMAYDHHRIMHIEAPSAKERVVFVQHYDNEYNINFPMRWWLVNTAAGWRVFDYQDLSMGLRTIEVMGILIGAGVAGDAEPWVEAFLPIAALMRSLDMDNSDFLTGFAKTLENLRQHELPDSIRVFASSMLVAVHQGLQDNDLARAELEASRDGGYASPMWHYQMASILLFYEEYDAAIQELEKHADTFGWDSDSLELLSDSHFHAGRMDEARAAALRALKDRPGLPAMLASLAAASTPEQIGEPEFASHFAQSENPEFGYEIALDYLIDLEAANQARALFAIFRGAHPNSELIAYYVQALALDTEE